MRRSKLYDLLEELYYINQSIEVTDFSNLEEIKLNTIKSLINKLINYIESLME